MTDASGERSTTRRAVLEAAGAASLSGAVATLFAQSGAARAATPERADQQARVTEPGTDPDTVFPQSVASGGPTPEGVILWTRLDPSVVTDERTLRLEVAETDAFRDPTTYTVPSSALTAAQDHTVRVDLDGELDPDSFYHYRFVYGGVASRTGRCRTLPEPDQEKERLRLALASCNNYLHGYFGGYAHIAEEDVDFLVHLGDFIYEYAGSGNQPDRGIELPSGKGVAHSLADFRHLHRTYRADEHMQRALERHTLVHTWDDHEIVNNRWWNYDEQAPETASHPYGDSPEKMKRLYVEGIEALTEYVPFRIGYDAEPGEPIDGDAIHEEFTLYRSVRFGRLAELFMTDERLYRSAPPEDAFGQRDVAAPPSREADDADRTMLGTGQREWLIEGFTGTDATWKLWGNSVLNAAIKMTNAGEAGSFYVNYDAWDGYDHERSLIMGALQRENVDNLVTLTGDMHAYVASYLLQDYESAEKQEPVPGHEENRVGVEFMTPGVTSDNLGATTPTPPQLEEDVAETMVESQNPHIEWFNWSRYGYTTIDVTPDACVYTAYEVDRTVDAADAPKQVLRAYRVPEGEPELQELRRNPPTKVVDETDRGDASAPASAADVGLEGGDGA